MNGPNSSFAWKSFPDHCVPCGNVDGCDRCSRSQIARAETEEILDEHSDVRFRRRFPGNNHIPADELAHYATQPALVLLAVPSVMRTFTGLLIAALAVSLAAVNTLEYILSRHDGFDIKGLGFIGSVWVICAFLTGFRMMQGEVSPKILWLGLASFVGIILTAWLLPADAKVFLETGIQQFLVRAAFLLTPLTQIVELARKK